MIQFFNEETDFVPSKKLHLTGWIRHIIAKESKKAGHINFIFCNDEYLHKLNVQHLQHDDLTDIISFDYCEGIKVSGDLYISVERVEDNAKSFKVSFKDELHRVIIHGVLHLLGYKDKDPKNKLKMTEMENASLAERDIHLLS